MQAPSTGRMLAELNILSMFRIELDVLWMNEYKEKRNDTLAFCILD